VKVESGSEKWKREEEIGSVEVGGGNGMEKGRALGEWRETYEG
jgi:hypothetical protein